MAACWVKEHGLRDRSSGSSSQMWGSPLSLWSSSAVWKSCVLSHRLLTACQPRPGGLHGPQRAPFLAVSLRCLCTRFFQVGHFPWITAQATPLSPSLCSDVTHSGNPFLTSHCEVTPPPMLCVFLVFHTAPDVLCFPGFVFPLQAMALKKAFLFNCLSPPLEQVLCLAYIYV